MPSRFFQVGQRDIFIPIVKPSNIFSILFKGFIVDRNKHFGFAILFAESMIPFWALASSGFSSASEKALCILKFVLG